MLFKIDNQTMIKINLIIPWKANLVDCEKQLFTIGWDETNSCEKLLRIVCAFSLSISVISGIDVKFLMNGVELKYNNNWNNNW